MVDCSWPVGAVESSSMFSGALVALHHPLENGVQRSRHPVHPERYLPGVRGHQNLDEINNRQVTVPHVLTQRSE